MPKLSPSASKKAKAARMHEEMGKFKRGTLHSGSKTGPVVESRDQAIAIGLSESGQSRKKRKSSRKSSRGGRR
jgi:Family of unknown function (DUF6496)